MRRWQSMMASRALTRWRCAVAELKRLERISVKVMRQWRGLDLNLAWLTWLELIQQAHEEKETKKGIEQEDLKQAADLLNEALRSANDELSMSRAEHGKLQRSSQQMVEAQGAYRERMMLRSAGRLLHRGMARAFGRWEECARAMREMRRKSGAEMRRWKQRELAIAFQGWQEERSRGMRMRAVTGKVVGWLCIPGRPRHGCIARAFGRWEECKRAMREMRRKAGAVRRRWKQRELAIAFQGWQEERSRGMRMRAVTGKVVGRWRRGGMWKAFATWGSRSRRARELRRIMRRWQSMMASRALTRWRCAVAELKRLERISVKVMRQRRGLDLNLAWLTWLELIQQAHEERETKKGIEQEDLKQAADLLNEALRSANDELSMSRAEHGKLQRSSQQIVEAQGVRIAGRLLHRGMARAFGRWEECARAMREMRRKAVVAMTRWTSVAKVICSWRGIKLREPFDVWHQLFVDAHINKSREHEWLACEALKQRNQFYRTIAEQACVMHSISKSIDHIFSEIYQLKNDLSTLKTKTLLQLQNVITENNSNIKYMHEIIPNVKIKKLQSSGQIPDAQGAYRERMLLRSAGRLLHRGMARAFGRWEECARAMREMRRKAGAVRRRWKQRELAIAFQCWLVFLPDIKAQRQSDFSSPLPTTVFSSRNCRIPVTSFSSRKGCRGRHAKISDPDVVALNPVYSGNHDFFGIFFSVIPFFPDCV